MSRITRVLETALYFDDLPRAAAFYRRLLEGEPLFASQRLVALDAGQGSVLLLFDRAASRQALPTTGGLVPGHTSAGPAHVAFAIDRAALEDWVRRLDALQIPLESRVRWEEGGESLYFRDPEGHSLELATQGTWPCY